MDNKNMVVGLIADHLRFSRIIAGLEGTGIVTLSEHPEIGKAVMELMGIKSSLAYMYYLSMVDESCVRKDDLLEDAEDIYNDILWIKEELERS